MGYKRTVDTVYAVYWADDQILKVGYSEYQRWKPFVARGAEVLSLRTFDTYDEASALEQTCHSLLRHVCERAFDSRAEARPYLGGSGGGYLECYRMLGAMHLHHASALLGACSALMQKRTEQNRALTKNLWVPFREILTFRNARGTATK